MPAAAQGSWLPGAADRQALAAVRDDLARQSEAQEARMLLLERRVQKVQGALDDLHRSLETLNRKLDGTLDEMDRLARISRDLRQMHRAGAASRPAASPAPASSPLIGPSVAAEVASAASGPSPGPTQEDVGQWLARGELESVITLLEAMPPDGMGAGWDAASRALWLGRAHLARRDFVQAAAHFRRMLQLAPAHPLAAQALLGLGVSQVRLPDVAGARQTLSSLLARFPASQEASHARALLFYAVGQEAP